MGVKAGREPASSTAPALATTVAGETVIDALIQDVYALAVSSEWTGFRNDGLATVGRWAGATAAAWVTVSHGTEVGEYTQWPSAWAPGPAVLLGLAPALPGAQVLETAPAILPTASASRVYVERYPHRHAGLDSLLVLLFPAVAPIPPALGRVLSHLVEAGALSLQQYIRRDEWLLALGRSNRGTTAVVDRSGAVYAASPSFRELVVGDASATLTELPFALPRGDVDGIGDFIEGPLHFRVSSLGGLLQLHARKPLPLDGLSPREQQIARALGSGKTFKSVARQYDIAVSTVANHASRIYRKLGVYRREDLVDLVRRPGGSASPQS